MAQKCWIDRVRTIDYYRSFIETIVCKPIKGERATLSLLGHHITLRAILNQKRVG